MHFSSARVLVVVVLPIVPDRANQIPGAASHKHSAPITVQSYSFCRDF